MFCYFSGCRIKRHAVGLGLLALVSGELGAFNFSLGSVDMRLNNRLTLGAALRLEDRDERLLAKLNVPGQESLCAPDNCMSLSGDPAPNQRLIEARGGYNVNGDDGNLNYDQYDFTQASIQFQPEFTAFWGDAALRVSAIAYYDVINSHFSTFNQNTLLQPRRVDRRQDLEDDLGKELRLIEAFVSFPVTLAGQKIDLSIGQQRLRWGESSFLVFSSLNQINPQSARLLRLPGQEIKNVFLPVGMVIAEFGLTADLRFSAFYQYDWEPVEPDVAGSFLSTSDVGGAGNGPTNVTLGIGQFPEDPDRQFQQPGASALITDSTRTTYLADERFGYPKEGGQFGLRINYYAEWLNGGTELSVYGMNYHSRLPYFSVFAADRSCLRDANNVDAQGLAAITPGLLNILSGISGGLVDPAADQTEFLQGLVACGGFNGTLNVANNNALGDLLSSLPGVPEIGQEPIPVDTLRPFLDYPEDIHLFGISGTTTVGAWSLAGEIAYSPNQPVQVATRDVVFAGLQPAFPEDDVGVPANDAAVFTAPGARSAVPDFLQTQFRNDPVEAGERIRGYERLQVGQASVTGIRAFSSSNWINADQILWVVEVGATGIFDLPDLNRLQIEGAGAQNTHFGPGADGSGENGPQNTARINPTQANSNIFADDFATGYRMVLQATYNNLLFGKTIIPRMIFYHDVYGTSAFPIQNFVEGRKRIVPALETRLAPNLTAVVNATFYTGAGDRNLRGDRDNLEFFLVYDF